MGRVTEAEVRAIIDTDITDITPFMLVANLKVTELLGDSDLSADILKEIERWLSAHFIAIKDPRTASEAAGSVSASYQNAVDLGLNVTEYGQMAMFLDTTGTLSLYADSTASQKLSGNKPVLEVLDVPNN